jgi:hypothetical protein
MKDFDYYRHGNTYITDSYPEYWKIQYLEELEKSRRKEFKSDLMIHYNVQHNNKAEMLWDLIIEFYKNKQWCYESIFRVFGKYINLIL